MAAPFMAHLDDSVDILKLFGLNAAIYKVWKSDSIVYFESNISVGSYNPIILKYLALGSETAMRASNKQKFESVIL